VTKDELLAHCLSKPGAWQDEPWEGDTVVKVGPKIFAFLGSGDGAATHGSVGVKCAANRDAADEWLKLYPDDASVMPYIGRSGWNTLRFGGAIPDDEVLDAVEESYRMIVAKLPKKTAPHRRNPEETVRRGASQMPTGWRRSRADIASSACAARPPALASPRL
jgi:predicted DNA-binding protein (MmcQ/YjbR family)